EDPWRYSPPIAMCVLARGRGKFGSGGEYPSEPIWAWAAAGRSAASVARIPASQVYRLRMSPISSVTSGSPDRQQPNPPGHTPSPRVKPPACGSLPFLVCIGRVWKIASDRAASRAESRRVENWNPAIRDDPLPVSHRLVRFRHPYPLYRSRKQGEVGGFF